MNLEMQELKKILFIVEELKAISQSIDELNQFATNSGLSKEDEKEYDKLSRKAAKLANKIGFSVVIDGDPRGSGIKLIKNKKEYDLYGDIVSI